MYNNGLSIFQCPLYLAPTLESYDWGGEEVSLGIPGMQQVSNASLAMQLCHFWMQDQDKSQHLAFFLTFSQTTLKFEN